MQKLIVTLALALGSCLDLPPKGHLEVPPSRTSPGRSKDAASSPFNDDNSPYFCPRGSAYDFDARFCVREGKALGPFTNAMVKRCKELGHGKELCESKDWPSKTAGEIRGSGPCPLGSSELPTGFCAEDKEVYGPFARERVEVCKREKGGEPCEWNRWSIFFSDLSRKVETGPLSLPEPTTATGSEDFAVYLLRSMDEILASDGGKGYSMRASGQHARNLKYNGETIFEVGDKTSHCVGMTFQVFVVALNAWFNEKHDSKAWNMPVRFLKWSPFKECWYVNAGCHGARDAIVKYGIGTPIRDFQDLKPGDFVNFDRARNGHSVMFLQFITASDTLSPTWAEGSIGFEYFSSQGTTRGAGKMRAYFDGRCREQHPNHDCGIIRSSLVMGRVAWPATFRPPASTLALAPEKAASAPGSLNARLDNP